MIGWRSLGCFVLIAGLVGLVALRDPAQAQGDKDKLEWKAFDFEKDKDGKPKSFYQILTTKTVQNMKVMQMDIKQEQNQTFYIRWTPQEKKDGNWVVKQQIIGVKMDIDIGGNKIPYDSTADANPKNPMSEFFEALTKAELTFHIDPATFQIKKIEGADEFKKKLAAANPQIKALLEHILSENALKQMAEPTWAAFPTKADQDSKTWKDKKTWDRESTLDLGPIGIYEFKNTYTWGDKDKVTIGSTVKYKVQKEGKKEGLPFVIKEGNLETKKGVGSADFDAKKGRFKEAALELQLDGTLTIDIGGMVTEVKLDQNQKSTVLTQDEDPVQAIKDAKKKQ